MKDENLTKETILSLLITPKIAINKILDSGFTRYNNIFLLLGSIAISFDRAEALNLGDKFSLQNVLVIILFGGLFNYIFYDFYSYIVSRIGYRLKGKAHYSEVRNVLAWALFPLSIELILWIIKLSIFGISIFQEKGTSSMLFYPPELYLSLLCMYIFITGLKIINEYNNFKAVINILLTAPLILISWTGFSAITRLVTLFLPN